MLVCEGAFFLGVWPEDAKVHQAQSGSRPPVNLSRFTKTL